MSKRARPAPGFVSLHWFEFPWIDFLVEPERVEVRFLDSVGTDGAAQPERKQHAVAGIPIVRVVETMLEQLGLSFSPYVRDLFRVLVRLVFARAGCRRA